MDVNSVSSLSVEAYSSYSRTSASTASEVQEQTTEEAQVVYEKSDTTKSTTYTVNKMSKEDREALVQQLKADQEARQQSLLDLVGKTLGKQLQTFSIASGDDSVWQLIASGNFEVDAATKAQAQEDISEDGYWGVTQTSQRLFDFASALAGDDEETMKAMQEAMMKGYKEATKSWGSTLPDITSQTMDAANALFEEYYKSKQQS